MSRHVRVAVLIIAATTLALGGCRGAVIAAPGGPPTNHVTSADPLGGAETRLDQMEKQIDHDGTG
jgi:hypothetical protein